MDIYIVQPGDDIETIANKYGISVTKLIQDNGLENKDFLVPGQTLVIVYPKQTHIVEEGETIASIGGMYNVTIMQLIRNNPSLINRNFIYPGETLIISYNTIDQINTHGFCYPYINEETLIKTLPYLTYLSIFSYRATGEGEFETYYEDERIVQIAKSFGVVPMMLATTLTPQGEQNLEVDYNILLNEQYQDRHLENVISILTNKGYSGVNFVFNFINKSNEKLYHNLIKKAYERLHKEGFLVFVTINLDIKAVDNEVIFDKLDYKEINIATNGMIFLQFIWGTNYGPPRPVNSMQQLNAFVDDTVTVISPDVITLGVPVISYDWPLPYVTGKTKANSLSLDSTLNLANTVDATIQFDEISQTPYFIYFISNAGKQEQHIVWSIDARTIDALVKLISEYKLGGSGIWNIMTFHTQLWFIINTQFEIIKIL